MVGGQGWVWLSASSAHGSIVCTRKRPHPAKPSESQRAPGGGNFGPAAAACRVESDGSLRLLIGSVDLTESSTGLAILAADAFGAPLEGISVELGDMGVAPLGPVAGGSNILHSLGPAVVMAAVDARRQVLEYASRILEAATEDLEIVDREVRAKGVRDRGLMLGAIAVGSSAQAPIVGQGRTYVEGASPASTVHLCRVRVDQEAGSVRVTAYAAIQDVGRAVYPPGIESQIHGGIVQGIGRALGEQLSYDDGGQLRSGSFLDYELPTADQLPADIDVTIVEVPSEQVLGLRGVGEVSAVPGPAAIANAVAAATGVRLRKIPLDSAQLLAAPPKETSSEVGWEDRP